LNLFLLVEKLEFCGFDYSFILLDEERIHDITKKLSEIDTLARVLDGECFQGIKNPWNLSL
jgi:hypothetical protein